MVRRREQVLTLAPDDESLSERRSQRGSGGLRGKAGGGYHTPNWKGSRGETGTEVSGTPINSTGPRTHDAHEANLGGSTRPGTATGEPEAEVGGKRAGNLKATALGQVKIQKKQEGGKMGKKQECAPIKDR